MTKRRRAAACISLDWFTMALERFDRIAIAVIGDVMLDCYVHGAVDRISPEAPVPVVRARNQRELPGGAANVVTNIASLGVRVQAVGLTGADDARDGLLAALATSGLVETSGLVADGARPTTRKLRILAGGQQMIRVDYEETGAVPPAVEAALATAATSAIAACDIAILSDYGKGVLCDAVITAAIAAARAQGRRIIVDPKRRDWSIYAGASVLTPNRRELSEATGLPCDSDAEVVTAAARAHAATGADILVTRSEKGMSFIPVTGTPIHLATVARNVFDVSGAGDTVIAVLAASLAAGFEIGSAMKMANHAAGIVVGKVGTATVSRREIAEAVEPSIAPEDATDGRPLSLDQAVALRTAWARQGLSVGLANGCFDLIHPGHVSLIRQAANSCDRLIMALNADSSVKRLKGPSRPLQDEEARVEVIGAMKGVAAVILFAEDTPLAIIEALQPDVLVKGADYTEDQVVGGHIVKARGGRVVLAQLMPGHSTTRLAAGGQSAVPAQTKVPA
ncbi:D-glycero-beta-D-manno-heptose-7-phosphate kinase [Bosea vaviloviae]|nr:D-glycero-beta-D-manno-heptose-7-phosphate kinase [Bosea vaviloviae]